jgi:hypothetical protein
MCMVGNSEVMAEVALGPGKRLPEKWVMVQVPKTPVKYKPQDVDSKSREKTRVLVPKTDDFGRAYSPTDS